MKKLHTFSLAERAIAGMYKDMLQREGVKCLLRNEELFAGLGEIPFVECYPELWVVDDDLYPRAMSLLKQLMGSESTSQSWVCSNCGEDVEGQFNSCWKCGQLHNDD